MVSVLDHAYDRIALQTLGDRISPRFSEALDRLIRTLLAGIAARKHGITDPFFVDPRRVDHGVPAP